MRRVIARSKLDALVDDLSHDRELDTDNLTPAQVAWCLNNMPSLLEWAENEKRIRELKARLAASLRPPA